MSNILEVANGVGTFSTLLKAAEVAGLADTLSTGGPFTIFAPTDEAFSELPTETLNALLEDPEKLKGIIFYHTIKGKIRITDLLGKKKIKTLQGQKIKIDTSKGVMVNKAKIIKPDIEANNGIIHAINQVLLPS
ncbi:hypothetical protein LCGC14_0507930 [marine sediment metagenome]|uniref:FAS1 domain-containing protein n=1 Tax=marine sediment metagenome TaxID=412755 RepID=A0A0F9UNS8_9ZZZZ|nr:fasciclin domain-containing protein [archaeon]